MPRTRFKGCIDIHKGQVKQIVGGTLNDSNEAATRTNFVAEHDAGFYAQLYRKYNVKGCHVIMLGPGCDEAVQKALTAWPQGLQVGGGVTAENAAGWIAKGASKVIVTSYLFPNGKIDMARLQALEAAVGKDRLVVDLSCRRTLSGSWVVAMNRWQTLTTTTIDRHTLELLADHCSEFLVHAADVEGLCQGIDEDLVTYLGEITPIPTVYAGGAKSVEDLELVQRLSKGRVDLTFGSALDIFGGSGVTLEQCVEWNAKDAH